MDHLTVFTAVLIQFILFCPVASVVQASEVTDLDRKVQVPGSTGLRLKAPHSGTQLATADQKQVVKSSPSTNQQAEYHFSLAQGYANEGETDRAVEEYKLALMFDPNSAILYARLSSEYIKKGMLSSAMEASKEALRHDPGFIDARLILGGLYSALHESQSALREYDQILKLSPKNEEALVYKAQVLIEDGKLAQAVNVLRRFTQLNSDSALVFYYLGRAEQQQNHMKGALDAYKKALSIRPGFSQAGLALGYVYEDKQMHSQALAIYNALFESSGDIPAAHRLATIFLKQEKYNEAVPYLQAIVAADPEDLNARVKLGLVQMELKKLDQAVSSFKAILEKNPESDRIHYYLGSVYEEKKESELAISELKTIKEGSKLFPDSALQVAFLLRKLGRVQDAKAHLAFALDKAPRSANLYIFKANLEEAEKQPKNAIKILENAIVQVPDDEKIRYYLGTLYDRQGDVDRSLSQMEAILKLNPDNVDAMNYIAYSWTQKGLRLDDVEKLLKRALVLRPDSGYIQDSWGWYLFVRGRLSQAVVELEKAARMKPGEATILEHLGDAYMRANLREKAMGQYLDAVKYTDNLEAKQKIEAKVETMRKETALATVGGSRSSRPNSHLGGPGINSTVSSKKGNSRMPANQEEIE